MDKRNFSQWIFNFITLNYKMSYKYCLILVEDKSTGQSNYWFEDDVTIAGYLQRGYLNLIKLSHIMVN